MTSVTAAIDSKEAIWIATRFLEQHHSILCADASLEDSEWTVTARVGIMPEHVKKVRVDAASGRITSCC